MSQSTREEIIFAINKAEKYKTIEKIVINENFYQRLSKEAMSHVKFHREDFIYGIPSFVDNIFDDYKIFYIRQK